MPSPGSVVAGLAGGGGGGVAPRGRARMEVPGEAVCARGGGGGGVDFAASALDCGVTWSVNIADVFELGGSTYVLVDPTLELLVVVERRLLAQVRLDR